MRSIEFRGAFLVTAEAWKDLLSALGGRLLNFTLTDTARFDERIIQALCEECTNLKSLCLSNILTMNDNLLRNFRGLHCLTSLELSCPGEVISDESIINLLKSSGGILKHLVLDGCQELTSRSFVDGVCRFCPRLSNLSMAKLESSGLSDQGLQSGFSEWPNSGLDSLSLSRCINIRRRGSDSGASSFW